MAEDTHHHHQRAVHPIISHISHTHRCTHSQKYTHRHTRTVQRDLHSTLVTADKRSQTSPIVCPVWIRLIYLTLANLIKWGTDQSTQSHTVLNLQFAIRLGAKQETGSVWNCGGKKPDSQLGLGWHSVRQLSHRIWMLTEDLCLIIYYHIPVFGIWTRTYFLLLWLWTSEHWIWDDTYRVHGVGINALLLHILPVLGGRD